VIRKEKAVKVGIFLTVVFLIFVIGQLWLLRFNIGKAGFHLNIFYDDVAGLTKGDPVRVYGINKGKVMSIDMKGNGVLVRVWIENDVVLREDARAMIQDVAMISGTKTIVIHPGVSDKLFRLSDTLQGAPNRGLSTVEIGGITEQIEDLLSAIKGGTDGSEGPFDRLSSTLKELELFLKENRKEIKKSIESGGKNLKKTEALIDNIDSSVKELDVTLKQINSRKGTMGKLVYDEKLYDNLTRAAANLDTLLVEVRKNPGKFVHVSVF
jgi:phospholipid/cholesterol/gamma-HCH transport system substrate-binding protein